jgi:hypothetical protein
VRQRFPPTDSAPRNNNFTIDGVDNNDAGISTAAMRVIPEQVSELLVQTAAYSAEFGRNSGAQIAATTKSGTNFFTATCATISRPIGSSRFPYFKNARVLPTHRGMFSTSRAEASAAGLSGTRLFSFR